MEAERLVGMGLLNADLGKLVSTAAHDEWKHEVKAESGGETQPWCALLVLECK